MRGGEGGMARQLAIGPLSRLRSVLHSLFFSVRTQGDSSVAVAEASSPPLVMDPTGAEVIGEGRGERVRAWGRKTPSDRGGKMSAVRVCVCVERDCMHCVRVCRCLS